MPFKRKYRRLRRPAKKRRVITRPRYRTLARGMTANKAGIYWFKRTLNASAENGTGISVDGTGILQTADMFYMRCNNTAAGSAVFGTMTYQFSLQNIPNISEFTSLFDSYQIRKVVINIIPYNNTVQAAQATNVGVAAAYWPDFSPIMHYVIDHDGVPPVSANEAGINGFQQYASYKRRRFTGIGPKGLSVVIKPRAKLLAGNAALTTVGGTIAGRNQWQDCAENNLPHFGFGMILEGISPGTAGAGTIFEVPFRMETTYYLKFKTIR
ncbi:capsid [Molossus molossus circovirus 4]|uniref:capsid n=1 Tax=Molossus molossus circovirus 4 TaxID=1959845 RepID=UPI000CA23C2B|nr:capsid [Molossus molossus circovirus 4]AQR57903.1 capsid [Molossus molossus circovirus 4]